MKKDKKDLFREYQVNDVKTVEEFCNKYYKNKSFIDRGDEYVKCVIESNYKYLQKFGYTFITHHDSITGEIVSFYK